MLLLQLPRHSKGCSLRETEVCRKLASKGGAMDHLDSSTKVREAVKRIFCKHDGRNSGSI